MTLRTLFLDAGGVLVHPSWERVSHTLARHGVEVSADLLAAAEPRAKRRLDRPPGSPPSEGERDWPYLDLVLVEAGVTRTAGAEVALAELLAYHQRWGLWERVASGTEAALSELRAFGLRLVVVSNSNGTLHTALERLRLIDLVDVVLDSHREGVEKPDPRFFELALERSRGQRETTAHVGDLYHIDVVGARSAGLRAVLLDEAGLHPDADCLRVASLPELSRLVASGSLGMVPRAHS